MDLGRQEIEKALRLANTLSVKAKIGWLAKYFNEYVVNLGLPEIQIIE